MSTFFLLTLYILYLGLWRSFFLRSIHLYDQDWCKLLKSFSIMFSQIPINLHIFLFLKNPVWKGLHMRNKSTRKSSLDTSSMPRQKEAHPPVQRISASLACVALVLRPTSSTSKWRTLKVRKTQNKIFLWHPHIFDVFMKNGNSWK